MRFTRVWQTIDTWVLVPRELMVIATRRCCSLILQWILQNAVEGPTSHFVYASLVPRRSKKVLTFTLNLGRVCRWNHRRHTQVNPELTHSHLLPCTVQITGKVTRERVTRESVGAHTQVLAPPVRVSALTLAPREFTCADWTCADWTRRKVSNDDERELEAGWREYGESTTNSKSVRRESG